MGQFFAIIDKDKGAMESLLNRVRRAGNELQLSTQGEEFVGEEAAGIYYPRLNNTGSGIIHDKSTESWLIAIGTWFHKSGIHSGQEQELFTLIQKKGLKSVSAGMDGFFNIIFYDGRSKGLSILTDIIGSCFCFVRKLEKGSIAVSTSSLLLAMISPFSLDKYACQQFLHTGVIYGDKSLFKEVRRLPPASLVEFDEYGNERQSCYWHYPEQEHRIISGDDAVDEFAQVLVETTDRVAAAFPGAVCDLTAGLDSRVLMSGFIQKNHLIDTVVVGDKESPDVIISEELAQIHGLSHAHIAVNEPITLQKLESLLSITDGELNLFEYLNIFNVHSKLAQQYRIGINGSFGEVARGYWWELLYPAVGKKVQLDSAMLARKRFSVGEYVDFFGIGREQMENRLADEITKIVLPLQGKPNTLQMDLSYLHMRMRCWQGRIASSTNRIWPCFSPIMMRPVLELLLRIEPDIRMRDNLYKKFLKKYNYKWAEHRTEYGPPALPMTLGNAYKFWPVPIRFAEKFCNKGMKLLRRTDVLANESAARIIRKNIQETDSFKSQFSMGDLSLKGVCNKEILEGFLKKSTKDHLHNESLWQRVVSLELTIQKVTNFK